MPTNDRFPASPKRPYLPVRKIALAFLTGHSICDTVFLQEKIADGHRCIRTRINRPSGHREPALGTRQRRLVHHARGLYGLLSASFTRRLDDTVSFKEQPFP
jgi:hypothetical protein